uniref:Tyrosine-protein kinase ephrin type A/B receptor-like domain-containing protein n=1 Tax=Globisporangium ultimum (strain ATCC 200006 / CBS 805.95 / DAOM BR144) TaxID=431595 RepID=K3WT20_GLOUD
MGLRITLCESSGNYVCIPCPAGLYLQSGTRNCLPCSEGTFSSIGAAECTKCPAGTYSTVVGKTSDTPCTQCPVGTSSNALGATSLAACAPCSPGTFAASSGSTVCSTCAPGTYSNASASACTKCSPGEWSSNGASMCQRCTAGSYSPYTGSASCFICPKGFYSDSGAGNCTACPLNTFSNTVRTASISGCQKCSSVSFTTATAQTRCIVCALGSSYIGSKCQLCSAGSYASEDTQGACLPCPKGSYAPTAGATQCRACPDGTTTAATGATSLDGCVYCSTGSALDYASNCVLCAAGTYPSSPGICSACAPGGHTLSAVEAATQQSGDCRQCAAMTYSSARGATHCDACGEGSFSLTGWRNCITCGLTKQQLIGCKTGRNDLLCSGNGDCIYGGCACLDAWTGADCSVALLLTNGSSASASTSSRAVLYFPASQQPNLTLFAFPITTTNAEIAIQVARSGTTDSSLRAKVVWSTSNFSSSSSSTSGFPKTLTFASGETIQTVTIPLSSLTPRSGCRFLTFTLTGTSDDLSSSAVSVELDNSITLYVDDMNGVDGGKSGQSINANYVGDFTIQPTANVTLDRVVVTQVTLSPNTTSGASVMLQDQRMNILVAIDRRSTSSASSLVYALPALIAALQTWYQVDSSAAIQMGLLKGNTSSVSAPSSIAFYSNLGDFFLAAQVLNQSTIRQEAMNYAWITAALTRNSSAWPTTGRRFLWIIDDTSQLMNSSSNPNTAATACQKALQAQSAFAFYFSQSSDGNAVDFTGAADVMQGITYESIAALPSRVLDAHVARDNTLPSTVNVLKDPSSLVTSAQVRSFAPSGGAGSLPVLSLVVKSIPSSFQSSTSEILLGIPGVYQLR